MNPIKYSDLIINDNNGFKELSESLAKASKNLKELMKTAKENAETLKSALGDANPASAEGQAAILKMSQEIDTLTKRIKVLEDALQKTKRLQKEANDLDAEAVRQKLLHKEAVKDLTNEVRSSIGAEKMEAEQIERLNKLTELQAMSYNELSKAYGHLKAQINEMTASTEAEAKARERLSATARGVYEQMNKLQQSTGKYTLQVGNYAKSWNGLNIAMQQIIRETPNMAMSFNTFFLAISNNIPILADQIQLAKDKHKLDLENIETMKRMGASYDEIRTAQSKLVPVGKQLLKSIFSWQTALVAGVTLLTMYGEDIINFIGDLIKMMRGVNSAKLMQEAFNESLSDAATQAGRAVAKLKSYYEVATDVNASMEDRVGAVKDLQSLYPKYFGNLSTEAILVGKAADKYKELSTQIEKTAMANAAMSMMEEINAEKMKAIIQMGEADAYAQGLGYVNFEDLKNNAVQKNTANMTFEGGVVPWSYTTFTDPNVKRNPFNKNDRKYIKAKIAYDEADAKSKGILKMMETYDLFGFLKENGGSGSGANAKPTVSDFYWEGINAIVDGMKDGLQKSLAQLSAAYGEQREKYKEEEDKLLELMKSTDREIVKEAENQMQNLAVLMATAEVNYQRAKQTLINDMLDSYREEPIENETELIQASVKKRAEMEKQIRDAGIYMKWESGEKTQEEVNKMLAESNTQFWKDYLKGLEEEGVLSPELYNEISSHLMNALDKAGKDASKGTKNNKKRAWTTKLLAKGLGVELDKNAKGYSQDEVNEFEIYESNLKDVMNKCKDYIAEVIDAYVELKQAAIDAAQAQVEAAQKVYDAELGAYENGYANNVEYARKEMALRKEQLAQAEEEKKQALRIQMAIDTALQASSLATAIANLFASSSKLGALGIPIASAASIAMVTAFTASKIMAANAINSSTELYGDGMHEYLDYGGSHSSGNDIDFGMTKDGKRRRVEKGEMIAVFNKRNTTKYGVGSLASLVDSINKGTFEKDYANIFSNGATMGGIAVINQFPDAVSRDISAIRKSTESQRYSIGNGTIIEKHRNRTRIIHIN